MSYENINTFQVARYKGYLTGLEDALQAVLDERINGVEWIRNQIEIVKQILDEDRREKLHYALKEHYSCINLAKRSSSSTIPSS